jgi:hypothetical protein
MPQPSPQGYSDTSNICVEYKYSSLLCNFLQPQFTSALLHLYVYVLTILFSDALNPCSLLTVRPNFTLIQNREHYTRVEAWSNTPIVTLRVVRGDEMGSLKSETAKYGREYQRTRTRERLRWEDPAAYTKGRSVLSSERAPHKNKTVTVK